MTRALRWLWNALAAVSLVLLVAVLAFFFGKRFGYDDASMPVTPRAAKRGDRPRSFSAHGPAAERPAADNAAATVGRWTFSVGRSTFAFSSLKGERRTSNVQR